MHAEAYATGVLVPTVHNRLVADLDNYAMDASIPKSCVWTSMHGICGPEEIAYMIAFRKHLKEGVRGFVMQGEIDDSVARMTTMAGFLVRNFIRAKVLTVNQWIDKEDGLTQYRALFIPNFFMGKDGGGGLPAWKIAALLDLLYARQVAEVQTFLYVADRKALAFEYGTAFEQVLSAYLTTIIV